MAATGWKRRRRVDFPELMISGGVRTPPEPAAGGAQLRLPQG